MIRWRKKIRKCCKTCRHWHPYYILTNSSVLGYCPKLNGYTFDWFNAADHQCERRYRRDNSKSLLVKKKVLNGILFEKKCDGSIEKDNYKIGMREWWQ